MILGIVGSRNLTRAQTYEGIYKGLTKAKLTVKEISKIVTGDAEGVDKFAAEWAKSIGIEPDIHIAYWNDLEKLPQYLVQRQDGSWYNKLAGINRNTDIAKASEILIAIQLEKLPTNGTNDTITKMKKLKKSVYEIFI